MKQQSRELDMGIPETIDHGDAVLPQDRSRIRGALPGYQQHGGTPQQTGIVDELPRGRGVSAALDLDGHLDLRAGEANDGVGAAAIGLPLAGENRDVWDALKNPHGLGAEGPSLIYDILVFHRSYEYSKYREDKQGLDPSTKQLQFPRFLLDELSEFARPALDALRQPLEDGRVAIVRARHSTVYPSRFMLVAATNPCPCGYAGVQDRCHCKPHELVRHRRRLSGPLLDRIDLLVRMERAGGESLAAPPTASSAETAERVLRARERQAARLREDGVLVNAHMTSSMLRAQVKLDERAEQMLARVRERAVLSARGVHRTLRVARTIADLEAHAQVEHADLAMALSLRPGFAADEQGAA